MLKTSESKRDKNHSDFITKPKIIFSTEIPVSSYTDHDLLNLESKSINDLKIVEEIRGEGARFRLTKVLNSDIKFKECMAEIRCILSSLENFYPSIIKDLLSHEKLRMLTKILQSKNGFRQREIYLCSIIILQGRKIGSYVDTFELTKYFNVDNGHISRLTELQKDEEFDFKNINLSHNSSPIKNSVNRLIHSVADEFNLSSRVNMLHFLDTLQKWKQCVRFFRNRIDKIITYAIIMKFNPNISKVKLAGFLIKQGPEESPTASDNLRKAYSRVKKKLEKII